MQGSTRSSKPRLPFRGQADRTPDSGLPCGVHPKLANGPCRAGRRRTGDRDTTLDPFSSPFVLIGPKRESWAGVLGEHTLQVEYERKVLFAEFRRTTYRVIVDGSVVWERRLLW